MFFVSSRRGEEILGLGGGCFCWGERVSTPLHAMPLGLFCKSAEETIIHLFSECFCSQYMWNQTQIFLLGNL